RNGKSVAAKNKTTLSPKHTMIGSILARSIDIGRRSRCLWLDRASSYRAGSRPSHPIRRRLLAIIANEKDDRIPTAARLSLDVLARQYADLAVFRLIRNSIESGIVRSSALAVVRLMTRSNLVGCSTGISPGFVPRRILST